MNGDNYSQLLSDARRLQDATPIHKLAMDEPLFEMDNVTPKASFRLKSPKTARADANRSFPRQKLDRSASPSALSSGMSESMHDDVESSEPGFTAPMYSLLQYPDGAPYPFYDRKVHIEYDKYQSSGSTPFPSLPQPDLKEPSALSQMSAVTAPQAIDMVSSLVVLKIAFFARLWPKLREICHTASLRRLYVYDHYTQRQLTSANDSSLQKTKIVSGVEVPIYERLVASKSSDTLSSDNNNVWTKIVLPGKKYLHRTGKLESYPTSTNNTTSVFDAPFTISLIGVGKVGSHILKALIEKDFLPASSITLVVRRNVLDAWQQDPAVFNNADRALDRQIVSSQKPGKGGVNVWPGVAEAIALGATLAAEPNSSSSMHIVTVRPSQLASIADEQRREATGVLVVNNARLAYQTQRVFAKAAATPMPILPTREEALCSLQVSRKTKGGMKKGSSVAQSGDLVTELVSPKSNVHNERVNGLDHPKMHNLPQKEWATYLQDLLSPCMECSTCICIPKLVHGYPSTPPILPDGVLLHLPLETHVQILQPNWPCCPQHVERVFRAHTNNDTCPVHNVVLPNVPFATLAALQKPANVSKLLFDTYLKDMITLPTISVAKFPLHQAAHHPVVVPVCAGLTQSRAERILESPYVSCSAVPPPQLFAGAAHYQQHGMYQQLQELSSAARTIGDYAQVEILKYLTCVDSLNSDNFDRFVPFHVRSSLAELCKTTQEGNQVNVDLSSFTAVYNDNPPIYHLPPQAHYPAKITPNVTEHTHLWASELSSTIEYCSMGVPTPEGYTLDVSFGACRMLSEAIRDVFVEIVRDIHTGKIVQLPKTSDYVHKCFEEGSSDVAPPWFISSLGTGAGFGFASSIDATPVSSTVWGNTMQRRVTQEGESAKMRWYKK